MAFVDSAIIHDSWAGTKTKGTLVDDFSVQYVIRVDDKADGPRFILEDCGLPLKGSLYAAGNDSHPKAVCKTVSVTPLGENVWRATASYGSKTSKEDQDAKDAGVDQKGEPVADVNMEGIDVQISLVQMSRPAVRAVYLGKIESGLGQGMQQQGFRSGPAVSNDARDLGTVAGLFTGGPVTNSCSVAFDPPPEIDYSRVSVNLSRNELELDANQVLAYNDTVNLNPFQVKFRGFNMDVPAFAAKMQTIGATRRIKEGIVYWRVNYEFHVDTTFGWRAEMLDRGYGMTTEFDPLAQEFRNTSAIPEFLGHVQPIVNTETGFTPSEPVNLDGNGMPLKVGQSPVYLVYGVYKETDWAPLKLNGQGVMI